MCCKTRRRFFRAALNQAAIVAGVPGRQSPELQYVGPIKHLIATVATLSIIRNIRIDGGGEAQDRARRRAANKSSLVDNFIGWNGRNCAIAHRISIRIIVYWMYSPNRA